MLYPCHRYVLRRPLASTLTLTPSEVLQFNGSDSDRPVVKLMPPATWILVEPLINSRELKYPFATPAEASRTRKKGPSLQWRDGGGEGMQEDD